VAGVSNDFDILNSRHNDVKAALKIINLPAWRNGMRIALYQGTRTPTLPRSTPANRAWAIKPWDPVLLSRLRRKNWRCRTFFNNFNLSTLPA
jgi:hypothetical protein